jgi:hypothetical protein
VPSFFKIFLYKRGLTADLNIVYRNFNLLLVFALLDTLVILFSLRNIGLTWPFKVCLAEFACLTILLLVHMYGNVIIARYITFLVTLVVQVTACIIHGKTAGFDYVFYAIALMPMLFFSSPIYYTSLFLISLTTMLGIQYAYTFVEPIILLEGGFVFYWNIFFTGSLIFVIIYIFKSGYERTQKKLLEQHNHISHQKEEIEVINNNLEQIIVDRTEKIRDQEIRITKFAFINAHKVRSPLARIMGLLNLIDLEKDKTSTVIGYLPILRENAEDLNKMLKEVSETLAGMSDEKTDHQSNNQRMAS